MLSPFLVSLCKPPIAHLPFPCFYECAHTPSSCFTPLAFPYSGASSLHRTKGLPFHSCQMKPSSAPYAAGAMDPSMCFLWLVV